MDDRIAYDLDGFICSEPSDWQILLMTLWPKVFVPWFHKRAKLLFKPEPNSYIITGRPEGDEPHTTQWLAEHGISGIVLYAPDENWSPFMSMVHKFRTLSRLKVDTYFESDPLTAVALDGLLVNTTVVCPAVNSEIQKQT